LREAHESIELRHVEKDRLVSVSSSKSLSGQISSIRAQANKNSS
jgi:hypothetical protein